MIHNYEFKARTDHLDELEAKLKTVNPHYVGEDHQIDTYFNVPEGRLKLRQGNIENSLIRYHRENAADSKLSQVLLYKHQPAPELKTILESSLGVDVVVDKLRKIYFIDHVKFHFDRVQGLGTFIEVEVIDSTGKADIGSLKSECQKYAEFLEVQPKDYVSHSYSDLTRELVHQKTKV